ncbi:coatomer subunit beta'-1-like [Magnolia sinica]|uniref:coatomer subunit beta'-1-like n=1 Tax=Magnolia sinica TaxID=86752 RepID=UPI00265A2EC9|nr:coatomer subunit beta'-1-like [Magnolia sinica]
MWSSTHLIRRSFQRIEGTLSFSTVSIKDHSLFSSRHSKSLKHNPNGRFVVVCGDGEYIIYTALAWRNRSFGSALEFVWSSDGEYAVRESISRIKIFEITYNNGEGYCCS